MVIRLINGIYRYLCFLKLARLDFSKWKFDRKQVKNKIIDIYQNNANFVKSTSNHIS